MFSKAALMQVAAVDPLPSDSSVCNGICSSNYQLCDSFLRGVWTICRFLYVCLFVCGGTDTQRVRQWLSVWWGNTQTML